MTDDIERITDEPDPVPEDEDEGSDAFPAEDDPAAQPDPVTQGDDQ